MWRYNKKKLQKGGWKHLLNEILSIADEIKDEIIKDRRYIHENAETGFKLSNTTKHVKKRLKDMGYEPCEICESGIVTHLYEEEKERCVILRADMDAITMTEKSCLPFAAKNGNMHSCGHDMHTAMLLGACKILKRLSDRIEGNVKIVFQPDEEGLSGAKEMISKGVLEKFSPRAAFSVHVHSGTTSGDIIYKDGPFMASCKGFRIIVKGKSCHGSNHKDGVDAINVASLIYSAIKSLGQGINEDEALISIGRFHGGENPNVISGEAVLEGTIRSFDGDLSEKIFNGIERISAFLASYFGARTQVEQISSAPIFYADKSNNKIIADTLKKILGKEKIHKVENKSMGAEDFAYYSKHIPSSYFILGAGSREEDTRYGEPMHSDKVVFNEDILPLGSAIYALAAMSMLNK